MFFKLILIELRKEFFKRKKVFLIFFVIPFFYLIYPLRFSNFPKRIIFEINELYIFYISIILFFHIDVMWNFINYSYGFHFYLLFPFKKGYILFLKLFSLFVELLIFLLILSLPLFILFKNFYLFIFPILNSLIFMTVLLIIVSLFSFSKYLHFPIFSFIVFSLICTFIRPNFLSYNEAFKVFFNTLGKILPPLDKLIINDYNLSNIVVLFLYITIGILLFFIISKKYEFKMLKFNENL